MSAKKIVIIGAGVAGLTAGVYSRFNGFDTTIVEAHSRSGGLLSTWERGGRILNRVNVYFFGCNDKFEVINTIWKELDVIDNLKFDYPDVYMRVEPLKKGDPVVNFYTDPEKLEKHLLEISSEDEIIIKKFIKIIKDIQKFPKFLQPAPEMQNLFVWMKLVFKYGLNSLMLIMKLTKITIGDFAKNFRSPVIRFAIGRLFTSFNETALLMIIWLLSLGKDKIAGKIKGGAYELIKLIESNFLKNNGKIIFNKKVTDLMIKDGKITGIKFKDGTVESADYVIWTGNLFDLTEKILKNKFNSPETNKFLEATNPGDPYILISIGLDKKIEYKFNDNITWCITPFKRTVNTGHNEELCIDYCFNQDFDENSKTKTVIEAFILAKFGDWVKLGEDKNKYSEIKKEFIDSVIDTLIVDYPEIKEHITFIDAASPLTYERFTSSKNGTCTGPNYKPELAKHIGGFKRKFPGIDNLFLASGWVSPPAGIPTSAYAAKTAIQLICKEEKKKFEV
jgi:phytoene dehydrogenase-like protein